MNFFFYNKHLSFAFKDILNPAVDAVMNQTLEWFNKVFIIFKKLMC